MRLYLDANFVVYCIEGGPALKEYCLQRLREANATRFLTGDKDIAALGRLETVVFELIPVA